jgi:NADH:ubiquinone reductase (H+-translocating)
MSDSLPKVVIVGGGFAGLAAAKALRKTSARIILIDRSNHHLFQPLLYQVATSVLTPGQIGSPIRGVLRKQPNTTVILGEVTGVDRAKKAVYVSSSGSDTARDSDLKAWGLANRLFQFSPREHVI